MSYDIMLGNVNIKYFLERMNEELVPEEELINIGNTLGEVGVVKRTLWRCLGEEVPYKRERIFLKRSDQLNELPRPFRGLKLTLFTGSYKGDLLHTFERLIVDTNTRLVLANGIIIPGTRIQIQKCFSDREESKPTRVDRYMSSLGRPKNSVEHIIPTDWFYPSSNPCP